MAVPAGWTPHRRPEDRELLGWIRPEGDDWVAVDILGRDASAEMDWLDAEAALEAVGLAWLGEVWMLEGAADGHASTAAHASTDAQHDAGAIRVRIVEITPDAGRIMVQSDDYGAIDVPVERYELPWPAPAALRPRRPGDPDATPFG